MRASHSVATRAAISRFFVSLWTIESVSAWIEASMMLCVHGAARGMTQGEAAAALGVSPRMWRYYEAGSHLLPKTVRLACAGFDAHAKAA